MSEPKRDWIMVALATALLTAMCLCCAEESRIAIPRDEAKATECMMVAGGWYSICDVDRTHELIPEFQRLCKRYPLKRTVWMLVVSKDVSAWYVTEMNPKIRVINIQPGGTKDDNIRRLRHEYQHAIQEQEKRKWDDDEARAAEVDK